LDVGDDTDQTMGLLLVAFSMSGRMGLWRFCRVNKVKQDMIFIYFNHVKQMIGFKQTSRLVVKHEELKF
jgi:hypothetical protein